MFQNFDWLKPPALWEQKWKSSPTRTPGRVARRTQFFEKLNPKKSTIKMLVAEVKPCNHVVAWHIHLVKIHTSLQRKHNFEENNRLKEHDFNYQQRCMSSWMQLELGQTPPVNPTCCHGSYDLNMPWVYAETCRYFASKKARPDTGLTRVDTEQISTWNLALKNL